MSRDKKKHLAQLTRQCLPSPVVPEYKPTSFTILVYGEIWWRPDKIPWKKSKAQDYLKYTTYPHLNGKLIPSAYNSKNMPQTS
jgi:hypothetical protein